MINTGENLIEDESSIRDTDMAEEVLNNAKFKIIMQVSQLMLMQSNEVPHGVLQLLS